MDNFGDAFILCGGKSARMGFDKSTMKIGDRFVVELIAEKLSTLFDNIRLSAREIEKYAKFGMPIIEDMHNDGIGPAAAIHAALSTAKTRYVFICACDMPFINPWYIEFMKSIIEEGGYKTDALIPINDGHMENLYAFYSISALKTFEDEISKGNYKVHEINRKIDAIYLQEEYSRNFDSDLKMFANLNYKADLERFGIDVG